MLEKRYQRVAAWIFAGALIAVLATSVALTVFIKRFTHEAPASLPVVQLSKPDLRSLQDRVESFQQALRQEQQVPPLSLSADEINALIENMPAARQIKSHLFFSIQDDLLKASVSLPLSDIHVP